ncbi:septum formation initiator family protein [Parvularcula marina]|uniref:FtsB family cell division protein n=1 Tax=Parvularcula marina TaxID=2292771 RepID=UPI00351921ED
MTRLVPVFQSGLAAMAVVAIAYNFLMMYNSSEGRRMNEILQTEIAQRQARLDTLEQEHAFLTDRTERLLVAGLDEDLLEERVRGVLGLVRPDEYLVRMEDLDRMAEMGAEHAREEERLILAAVSTEHLRYAGLETLLIKTADSGA